MDDGFQFFDIILFAMIAVFLILRLRSVLGRRGGHQGGFTDLFNRSTDQDNKPGPDDEKDDDAEGDEGDDNVIQLTDKTLEDSTEQPQTPLEAGIAAITAADPDFVIGEFVSGARAAFEMILSAYASGDSGTLKPMLGDEVYANFERSIRDRESAEQTMEETLVSIRTSEPVEAEMVGREAQVTVKFVSEQVHALYDKDGSVIEGDSNKIITVTDFWTFVHNTRARDPNWALSATRSLD